MGALQAVGVGYFAFAAPEEAVWRGVAIDVPVLGVLFGAIALKLVTAFLPGLAQRRRVRLGFTAVALSVVATPLKVTLYDEPEALTLLATDAVLLAFLLLSERRRRG